MKPMKTKKKRTRWAVMRTDTPHPVFIADTLDGAVAKAAHIIKTDAPHTLAFGPPFGHYVVEVSA